MISSSIGDAQTTVRSDSPISIREGNGEEIEMLSETEIGGVGDS